MKKFIRVPRDHVIDPIVPSVQKEDANCGPTILQGVFAKYGHDLDQEEIGKLAGIRDYGTLEAGMMSAIEAVGLTAEVKPSSSMETLYEEVLRGNSVILCITAWGCSHWVALIGSSRRNWYFADPMAESGRGYIRKMDFIPQWYNRRAIVVSGSPRRNSLTTIPFQRIPE